MNDLRPAWTGSLMATLAVCLLTGCAAPGVAQSVKPGVSTGIAIEPFMEGPVAAWGESGETFLVVTWGSSSCPAVANSMTTEGHDRISMVFKTSGGQVCTADMAPTTHEFELPPDLTGRPVTIGISYEDWPETHTLTLD